jgi:hypothetical protein
VETPARVHRLLPRQNLAASVYGTILVSSVIVGLGKTGLTVVQMAIVIGVTTLVFALAHAWSRALARSAEDREALSVDHLRHGIAHEWPMVESALPALVALGLAGLDVYSVKAALWTAISANTVLLFVWGAVLRHRAGGTAGEYLAAGITTAVFGIALVLLKVAIH